MFKLSTLICCLVIFTIAVSTVSASVSCSKREDCAQQCQSTGLDVGVCLGLPGDLVCLCAQVG